MSKSRRDDKGKGKVPATTSTSVSPAPAMDTWEGITNALQAIQALLTNSSQTLDDYVSRRQEALKTKEVGQLGLELHTTFINEVTQVNRALTAAQKQTARSTGTPNTSNITSAKTLWNQAANLRGRIQGLQQKLITIDTSKDLTPAADSPSSSTTASSSTASTSSRVASKRKIRNEDEDRIKEGLERLKRRDGASAVEDDVEDDADRDVDLGEGGGEEEEDAAIKVELIMLEIEENKTARSALTAAADAEGQKQLEDLKNKKYNLIAEQLSQFAFYQNPEEPFEDHHKQILETREKYIRELAQERTNKRAANDRADVSWEDIAIQHLYNQQQCDANSMGKRSRAEDFDADEDPEMLAILDAPSILNPTPAEIEQALQEYNEYLSTLDQIDRTILEKTREKAARELRAEEDNNANQINALNTIIKTQEDVKSKLMLNLTNINLVSPNEAPTAEELTLIRKKTNFIRYLLAQRGDIEAEEDAEEKLDKLDNDLYKLYQNQMRDKAILQARQANLSDQLDSLGDDDGRAPLSEEFNHLTPFIDDIKSIETDPSMQTIVEKLIAEQAEEDLNLEDIKIDDDSPINNIKTIKELMTFLKNLVDLEHAGGTKGEGLKQGKQYPADRALRALRTLYEDDGTPKSISIRDPFPDPNDQTTFYPQQLFNYLYRDLQAVALKKGGSFNAVDDSVLGNTSIVTKIKDEMNLHLPVGTPAGTVIQDYNAEEANDISRKIWPLSGTDYFHMRDKFQIYFDRIDNLKRRTELAINNNRQFIEVKPEIIKYREATKVLKNYLYRYRENLDKELEKGYPAAKIAELEKNIDDVSRALRRIDKIDDNLKIIKGMDGVEKQRVFGILESKNTTDDDIVANLQEGELPVQQRVDPDDPKFKKAKTGPDSKLIDRGTMTHNKVINQINFDDDKGLPHVVNTITLAKHIPDKGVYGFNISFKGGKSPEDLYALASAPRKFEGGFLKPQAFQASIAAPGIAQWAFEITENLLGTSPYPNSPFRLDVNALYNTVLKDMPENENLPPDGKYTREQAAAKVAYQLAETIALYLELHNTPKEIISPPVNLKPLWESLGEKSVTVFSSDPGYVAKQRKLLEDTYVNYKQKLIFGRSFGFDHKSIQEKVKQTNIKYDPPKLGS